MLKYKRNYIYLNNNTNKFLHEDSKKTVTSLMLKLTYHMSF